MKHNYRLVVQTARYLMKIGILFLLIHVFLIIDDLGAQAEENEVYFTAPNPEKEAERTDMYYVNETQATLYVKWGQDCSHWCVDMHSPLFADSLSGTTPGKIFAGEAYNFGIDLNPQAPPGEYSITVYLNYTDESSESVTEEHNFSIRYQNAFEVLDFILPTTDNKVVSLEVETFYRFSELKVMFLPNGDLDVEDDEILLTSVGPGIHSFETNVFKPDVPFVSVEQLIGYVLTGTIGGRSIWQYQERQNVSISWNDADGSEELTYNNAEDALAKANDQLEDMTAGNIQTIDGNDESFHATLMLDHMIGNVYYWMLMDSEIIVNLEANTGEIISYMNTEWCDGNLTQAQIVSQAEQIASQFADLPSDRTGPVSELRDLMTEEVVFSEGEVISTTYDYWVVRYNRVHESIPTEDTITLFLMKNGDLASYGKIWFMDLEGFSTSYTVTKAQAKKTALKHAGKGSTVRSCTKKIVRLDRSWDGPNVSISFGEDPVCVYEVYVQDADDNLCIYHIDGNNNVIVGVDYCASYNEDYVGEQEPKIWPWTFSILLLVVIVSLSIFYLLWRRKEQKGNKLEPEDEMEHTIM